MRRGSRSVLVSTPSGLVKVVRDSKKHKALVCKANGGHVFDGPDDPDACIHCGTRRPPPKTFARLAYLKWWADAMRDLWRGVGVEMVRGDARDLARRMIADEDFEPGEHPDARRLVEFAMVDYRLKNPRSRGENPWVFTNPTGRGRGDIACRFCRRVLLTDQRLGYHYGHDPRVRDHVVECAISSLATGASAAPTKGK